MNVISGHFKIPLNDLTNKKRQRKYVMARNIAMTFMRLFTELTYREIGIYFSKDHATVLHSVNNVLDYYSIYDDFKNEIDYLHEVIMDDELLNYKHYDTDSI